MWAAHKASHTLPLQTASSLMIPRIFNALTRCLQQDQQDHVTSTFLFDLSPPLCPSTQLELTVFVFQVNKPCGALIQPGVQLWPSAEPSEWNREERVGAIVRPNQSMPDYS